MGLARESSRSAGVGAAEWLFNPFRYLAGGASLAIGLAAILLAGVLGSFSRTHFDGVLDVHTGLPAPTWAFAAEGFIDWLSLAVVLVILGKVTSRAAFRAVDLLGTQAMARWPSVIIAAVALLPSYQRFAAYMAWKFGGVGAAVQVSGMDVALFASAILVIVASIVWMVALMYRSYSICCNIRGGKAAATFVIGVLVAEVVSKLVVLRMVAA